MGSSRTIARWAASRGLIGAAAALLVAGCGATTGPSSTGASGAPGGPPASASSASSAPVPSATRGVPPETPRPSNLGPLDQALAELADDDRAVAIGFARSAGTTWRGVYGPPGGPAVGTGARFGLASTGKTYTAVLVLQLVAEGRLDLDDTVEHLLPGTVRAGDQITVRQLLNHTSGLVGQLQPIEVQPDLISKPGTEHHYANVNFQVAAMIVESVSGRSADELALERIIRPLGMTHASTGAGSGGGPDLDSLPWLGQPAIDGNAATTDDLATFFSALVRGDLLAAAELHEMLETVDTHADAFASAAGVPVRAGLGIFRLDLPCGIAWGHGGDMAGLSNQVLVSPDGATAVVVAQDVAGWPQANATARELFCLAGRSSG